MMLAWGDRDKGSIHFFSSLLHLVAYVISELELRKDMLFFGG